MDDVTGFYTGSRQTLAESISGAPRRAVIAFCVTQPLSVKGEDFAFRELHSQQILAGRNLATIYKPSVPGISGRNAPD